MVLYLELDRRLVSDHHIISYAYAHILRHCLRQDINTRQIPTLADTPVAVGSREFEGKATAPHQP